MNRGHVLQSSPVQQMAAAGNPNWWSMMRPPPPLHHQPSPSPFLPHPSNLFPHQYVPSFAPPSSSSPLPNSYFLYDNNDQDLHRHESLSQLLLGGLVEEGVDHQKSGMVDFDEVLRHQQASHNNNVVGHVKQETSSSSYNMYGHGHHGNQREEDDDASAAATTKHVWSPANMLHVPSFAKPCLSEVSTNMLDFSTKNDVSHPRPDRSSESNSSTGSGGGATKKARVQQSSAQSSTTTIKVRKEKLGDRITSLHQLVSPFGKTDTASVLLEAIGYIRFLQNQIEALSLPYLGNGSGNNDIRQLHQSQQSGQGERNCLFPEDPGQLLDDNRLKRKGALHDQTCNEEPKTDLRSKGLCLVPVSCMLQVGSDNGADYWAPALGAGAGFR